jgi:chromosome segregation ATPase
MGRHGTGEDPMTEVAVNRVAWLEGAVERLQEEVSALKERNQELEEYVDEVVESRRDLALYAAALDGRIAHVEAACKKDWTIAQREAADAAAERERIAAAIIAEGDRRMREAEAALREVRQ